MKNTKRKSGISLIVLVITIIVMIILASSIILSLSNSGIIDKANKAKNDTDVATLKEVAGVAAAEYELEVAKGSTTQTKKEYVEEYLTAQGLSLPEGYEVTEEGQIAEASKTQAWDGTVATSFASGTGTEADPYIIETASELAYLAEYCNASNSNCQGKYFKLVNDIDLNNISWTPIGKYFPSSYFSGYFDGNNKKISNLYVNKTTFAGLFGAADKGVIENVIIESGNITGNSQVGSIVGAVETSQIVKNCINRANVSGKNDFGGIVGSGSEYTIDCTNYGTVTTID